MGKKMDMKYFVAILLCTAFIYSSAYSGEKALRIFFNFEQTFPSGTYVNSINIENLGLAEAKQRLQKEVETWQEKKEIKIIDSTDERSLPLDLFQFNLDETLTIAQTNQSVPFIVTINSQNLQSFINSLTPEYDKVDFQTLEADLLAIVQQMDVSETKIELLNYITSRAEEETILSFSLKYPKENEAAVNEWIQVISPLKIMPKQELSLLSIIEGINVTEQNIGSLNQVSSLLYKTIIHTNFEIRERYISTTAPSSIELGYEVKLVPSKMDFIFYNPNNSEYTIELVADGTSLISTVKGPPFNEKYGVEIEKSEYEPRTIIQYAPILSGGKKKIAEEGKKGYLIKVFKTDKNIPNSKQLVSEDIYLPEHRREVHELPSTEEVEDQPEEQIPSDININEIINMQQQQNADPEAVDMNNDQIDVSENDENSTP